MNSSTSMQFADSQWLWIVVVIPVVMLAYYLFYRAGMALDRLKSFADQHLLPHLVRNRKDVEKRTGTPLIIWSLIWLFGALAMAGPRWDFRDVEAVKPERALIILLDLSASMDAQDVKPSRVARARQKIEDILNMSEGLNVGLIAFASIPHMVAPLTDDMGTIRNFVPHLDTSLVYMQGSRLEPAMEMAMRMLQAVPGKDKSILVVSDGGFVDNPIRAAREAYRSNIEVYTLGVGTPEGAPIPTADGSLLRDRAGTVVVAKMDAGNLQAVAKAGGGFFAPADYTDNGVRALLHKIGAGPDNSMKTGKTVRIWDEKFYIPALVMAVLLLPWFRRGYVFPLVILGLLIPAPVRAATISDMFMNPAQQGRAAYDQGDYGAAAQKFDTPYRKGISEYKAGAYDKAIEHFNADNDPKTKIDSEYNRGNAQLKSGRLDEAIASYEDVLKQRPGDKNAQRNLEIARKIKEHQEEQQKQQDQQQKQDQQQPQQQGQNQQQKQDQQQQQSQNQQQKQDQQQQQSQNQQQKQDQQQQQSQNQQQKQDQQQQQSQNQQQKQDQQQQQAQNQQQSEQQNKEKGIDSAGQQKSDATQKNDDDKQDANKAGGQAQVQQDKSGQQPDNRQELADSQQGKNSEDQKAEKKENSQEQNKKEDGEEKTRQAEGQQDNGTEEQKNDQQQQASAQQDKKREEQRKQQTADQQDKGGLGEKREQAAPKAEDNKKDRLQAGAQKQDDNLAKQVQSGTEGSGSEPQESASMSGNTRANSGSHRAPEDVDADQWLSRAESDPGPLLKNQFMIESQRSAAPQGDDPW